MALSDETRAWWVLPRLDGAEAAEDATPPEATDLERAELLRDAHECREIWKALGRLDEPIAAEAPSPGVNREFETRLAEAIRERQGGPMIHSRPPAISRRAPRPAWLMLAASLALVALLVLSLWRTAPRSPDLPPPGGDARSPAGPGASSASRRLAAVLARTDGGEPAGIEELGRALQSDPNPNVRLAALEVLAKRFTKESLEGRIAPALAREPDPLVRLELIRTIGERNLVRDGRSLGALALDPRLDDLARDEIARVRERLGT